jgi:pyruvate-formate lyase
MSAPGAQERLRDLVITYLRRGGFETQINVVDYETLRAARENPEGYEDLVVRIGGYTDYFTKLSPGMQDEVLMRTEYEMA